jgi:diguanylate cyclase (GGDEF)-like protein
LFESASRDVLEYLTVHVPLRFWAVTRVENGRQTYLAVRDSVYGLSVGDFHLWQDSFCVHMASGAAPAVAPDARSEPLYAAAGVNQAIPIGAYAGSVIEDADGELFGAICGLDPDVRSEDLLQVAPLLQLLGRTLTLALVADRRHEAVEASALRAQLAADVDALTGVLTRGAWERTLELERPGFEQRADPTAVVVVDLDGLKHANDSEGHAAGDQLLVRAAQAIRAAVRGDDPVARLGGDEFAVLLRSCTGSAADDRAEQIRASLLGAGVAASVGHAAATRAGGLAAAQEEADRAMYQEKRRRKAG